MKSFFSIRKINPRSLAITFALAVCFQSCSKNFSAEAFTPNRPLPQNPVESVPNKKSVANEKVNASNPADPVLMEKIASAFVQAVTDGQSPNLKVVNDRNLPNGSVDFRNCNSSLSFDRTTCLRPVYFGKDGKTILMEVLNEKNVFSILPVDNARKASTMELFINLATPKSLTTTREGLSQKVLKSYFDGIAAYGPKNLPGPIVLTYFDDIMDTDISDIRIDIMVEQFPKYYAVDALYFWALTVAFTPAAGRNDWWGHVGIQITSNSKCGAPDGRCANWGGGGNGDGTGNYGSGGSKVIAYPWEVGTTYTYRIYRKDRIMTGNLSGAWNWEGQIINKKTGAVTILGTLIGGDAIVTSGVKKLGIQTHENNPHVMTETGYGVRCDSPSALVVWSELKLNTIPFSGKTVAYDSEAPCASTLQLARPLFDVPTMNYKKSFVHGLTQSRPPDYKLVKDLDF